MKQTFIAAAIFSLIAASTLPLAAQTEEAKPSLNPTEEKNPFGMGLLAKDRPKDAKTEITAKTQATFDNTTSIAEFEGNVVVKDPQFTLFCDKLKVILGKNRKGMERVEAYGKVVIVQDNTDSSGKVIKSIGRGGKAVYEPSTGDIILTIWPSVQHDINRQEATADFTVMTLNRSGKSRTEGPSKTSIVDNGGQ